MKHLLIKLNIDVKTSLVFTELSMNSAFVLCLVYLTSHDQASFRTYMRASMTENRLTGLALMHIYYAITVDLDKVNEEFANKHPWEMKLQSIIYDY